MLTFIAWCLLLVFCWPLALLALVLWPVVWLLSLPFRLIGITFEAVFALLKAVLMLPARVLGYRARTSTGRQREAALNILHLGLAIGCASLAACGGGGNPETEVRQSIVYKSLQARQCEGGGLPLTALVSQLVGAGVTVITASCGNDGRVYPAVCGAPTGAIGILNIPQASEPAAAALGFAPLAELPLASKTACP